MVRAALPHQTVGQHLTALPLDQLLEGGLEVPAVGDLLPLLVQDQVVDQLAGLADAAVQIHGGQHGLHRVRLDGGTLTAAAALLAPAQLQIAAQIQGLGHLHQTSLADQGRPDAGQIPLGQIGPVAVQVVGHHQS